MIIFAYAMPDNIEVCSKCKDFYDTETIENFIDHEPVCPKCFDEWSAIVDDVIAEHTDDGWSHCQEPTVCIFDGQQPVISGFTLQTYKTKIIHNGETINTDDLIKFMNELTS